MPAVPRTSPGNLARPRKSLMLPMLASRPMLTYYGCRPWRTPRMSSRNEALSFDTDTLLDGPGASPPTPLSAVTSANSRVVFCGHTPSPCVSLGPFLPRRHQLFIKLASPASSCRLPSALSTCCLYSVLRSLPPLPPPPGPVRGAWSVPLRAIQLGCHG